ncbi:hypothetical protein QYE76_062467 [Lolium multiflorum]|uniref:Leucine-rich repeat-containing N-terminal plant-type domain-containing protein n=1 Tax=Lolium multiflorum TaxID=4521 RepID=A0AAD8S390_LOLMU|nr:hypothetical protein QYE76_062467 [Lolium multiflorum]
MFQEKQLVGTVPDAGQVPVQSGRPESQRQQVRNKLPLLAAPQLTAYTWTAMLLQACRSSSQEYRCYSFSISVTLRPFQDEFLTVTYARCRRCSPSRRQCGTQWYTGLFSNTTMSFPTGAFIGDLTSPTNSLNSHSITGSLPDFSEFEQLSALYVDHNQITGVVPPSLPRLEDIHSVYLSGNLLQGPVPEFNSSVQTDVAKASATGSFCRLDRGPCAPEVESLLLIAGAFGYPHSLAASWMRNDPCAGWIGVHCDDRRRVTGIDLSRLGLSGTMDSAFGSLRSLEAIDLSGNNITGEIPASVAQLPSLRVIDVSNNNLVGTLPNFRHNVAVWTEGNPGLKQSGSSLSALNSVGLSTLCLLCLLFSCI